MKKGSVIGASMLGVVVGALANLSGASHAEGAILGILAAIGIVLLAG
jgi:hypothetical protein